MIKFVEKHTWATGLITIVALVIFRENIVDKLSEHKEYINLAGLISYCSSLGGLLASFIFAFYAVIIAYPNRFSLRIKKMKAYEQYKRYCLQAVLVGLVFSFISLFVVSYKLDPFSNFIDYLIFSIWMGFFISAFALGCRAILGFFIIVQ
ncbi:hypothetical protein GR183_09650 [Stappia sp. GBMRC 2046]|uniref:Uncharacterized protein n=1 Tax=Stappia sediminis TaxID=2692190 RepID=A0A7X3LU54_9HYPH|nr:hypothetical protein [Stappia sediminis]MXN65172.1 hypothetical protein [Stappia sediminis]